MEFVNELLEEQQELLLENLKWSEGEERLQDINRLEEVVRALSILSEVGVELPKSTSQLFYEWIIAKSTKTGHGTYIYKNKEYDVWEMIKIYDKEIKSNGN